MFIGGIISFILLIWMITRIWKDSAVLAIVSFFFWPALIFAVIKYWGDEESDIKVPFAVFMVASIYAWYDILHAAKPVAEDSEALLAVIRLLA
jgi:hypothetical protein